jgi:hypothetical protein
LIKDNWIWIKRKKDCKGRVILIGLGKRGIGIQGGWIFKGYDCTVDLKDRLLLLGAKRLSYL